MPLAELVGDRIVIDSEYREVEQLKLLPGGKWDSKNRTWWCPLSWASCIQLRGIFGSELKVGSNLGAWAKNERTTRIDPCIALRTAEDGELTYLIEGTYPFQRAGIKFMSLSGTALCADDMGLGKTVQGILTLEEIGDEAYPALVVCPNSKKYDWDAEYGQGGELIGGFLKWAPHRRVVVISGGKQARVKQIAQLRDGEADVGIINWEGLRGHTSLAGFGSLRLDEVDKLPKELNEVPFSSVVADEAHRAKEPRAKQTRALWRMGESVQNRIALTGTPVVNSPEDLWSLMHFVLPSDFTGKSKFIQRYALQSWNMFGGLEIVGLKSETKDELFSILDPHFIRRTKAAVLPQLPEKIPVTRTVELVPKQRKAYDSLRKEMLAELDSGILVATNPLTKMTRLLQLASAYAEFGEDGALTLTEPSCKVDALMEIVEELGEQRAIVFAESRQLIELAYRKLLRPKPHGPGLSVGLITGSVSALDRKLVADDFTAGKHRLLLMTLGAGAEGLSFPGCSVAIFLQRSFSMVKNVQAEDRIHGIGRGIEGVRPMIIDVISKDTIEQRVHEVRAEKAAMLEEVARDADTLRTWLAK